MSNSFYREIINEHNLRPIHKHILPRAGLSHRGINPSCGDDITLQLTVEDGVITEGAYVGDGCAISQASADMMLDLIIGRTPEEALHLADIFLRMIKGKVTDAELKSWRKQEVCRTSRTCRPESSVPCSRGTHWRKY